MPCSALTMSANATEPLEKICNPDRLEAELNRFAGLKLPGLRQRWKLVVGRPAPTHLPEALLHQVLAYRAQADALGDLDRETARMLDRLGAGTDKTIAKPMRRDIKPGTLLVREWKGVLQRVMVLEHGFAWNGQTFESLSRIAREITGTAWNGPRFFGLRAARERRLDRGSGRLQLAKRVSTYQDECKPMSAERGDRGSSAGILRCLIYTRVSTEHGLAQEFNSLDNQREAAEAYVKSQAEEGWRLLPGHYDDGGYSGGSLERPALQRLLAEIGAGRIDVVVVYKVDRLTRSLADFAKLVELFDQHGVSFVSVTQAFNTTTSMGRLTLNVLLSFAQFEREVTGERIRDKIAASKSKGIWMGGQVPLGYRVDNRALHVVPEQADAVRHVYERYLEIGSILRLKADLKRRGIVVPRRVDGAGRVVGGVPFGAGYLRGILRSPLYAGRLRHKDKVHDGQHAAIVDQETWDAVQAMLAENTCRYRQQQQISLNLLTGRIRDRAGITLTPCITHRGARRYRYYVSQALLRGKARKASRVRRIAAPEIEAAVVQALRSNVPREDQPSDDSALVRRHLALVVVHPDRLELRLTGEAGTVLTQPWAPPPTTRRGAIIAPPASQPHHHRPMKVEDRTRILKAIGTARLWLDELTTGRIDDMAAIARHELMSERAVRMTLSLAFLSPAIVSAIMDAKLPRGVAMRDLAALPPSWAEQHRTLGL